MNWPDAFEVSAVALDPAEGKKTGDYTAAVFCGWAQGRLWVDSDLEKVPPEAGVGMALDLWDKHNATCIGAEAQTMRSLLVREFRSQCRDRGIVVPSLHIIRQHEAKHTRIMSLGGYLARGMLRFLPNKGNRLLVRQLKEFPNADHDDGPDALHMAVSLLVGLSAADIQQRSTFRPIAIT